MFRLDFLDGEESETQGTENGGQFVKLKTTHIELQNK